MIATGRIALIEDEGLRQAVLSYYAVPFWGFPDEFTATAHDVNEAFTRSLMRHLGPTYLRFMDVCSAGDLPECFEPILERTDLADLHSDLDVMEQAVAMAIWAGRVERRTLSESAQLADLSAWVMSVLGDL